MKVIGFQSKAQLEKYINDNALTTGKVVAIYYDSASGEHVLVHTP